MDHAWYLLKAASLMFLLAAVCGCATLSDIKLPQSFEEARREFDAWRNKQFPGGQVRNVDKYCDKLEEPSYGVTDNVIGVALATGFQIFEQGWQTKFKNFSLSKIDIEKMAKSISNEYLWMPVSFEQALGNYLHARQVQNNKVLERKTRRNQTLYKKVDTALASAQIDYIKVPYEIRLFIVEHDQINAEALPAGYIYVTRTAANELDDNALQLILGHEIAHIAKRHTSKQLQQRLLDTGLAAEMLQRIIKNRSMDGIDKVFAGERVRQRLNGIFAQYDQGQELQADACSIRGMLRAGTDPLKAREEYLRIRGTREAESKPSLPKPFGLGFTQHPEDQERDHFFREAYEHHRRKQ